MKSICKKSVIAAATFCFSMAAWAVEPDELQGRVLSIDEDEMTITVQVTEVGSRLDAPVDSIQTYQISEDTNIVDDLHSEIMPDDLGDIQADEEVTLEFDVEDGSNAHTIIFYVSGS